MSVTLADRRRGRGRALRTGLLAVVLAAVVSGCAAVSNPVADAVPIRRLPPEVMGERKEEERTIPLTWLRQKPAEAHRAAAGDLLGIWVEGVFGTGDPERPEPPPVRPGEGAAPPAIGNPFPVRENGTIELPFVPPIKVEGLTLDQIQAEVVKAYTETKKFLKPGQARVTVTLMRPRHYHVLVVRQDTGAVTLGGGGPLGGGLISQTKRGTGYAIDLPAYENDVLNALNRTGGLPGLDARNEVVIQRGTAADPSDPEAARRAMEQGPSARTGGDWVRIPLRLRPGEPPPFRPEDVVLSNGDIVFIEARDTEVFYVGGLLPSRQIPLPRDYDLDVVQAIAFANGPLVNGGVNNNNLAGNIVQGGIGFPSPSLATVLRRTHGGGQIPIRVDLNRALRDPRERVLIQPGDIIILQETPLEAISRYVTNVLRLNFFGTFIRERDLLGTGNLAIP